MPNIAVNTTSTSFGLLPADLSQLSDWLSQYSPDPLTIYQDQSNVLSGMLTIANTVDAYLAVHGYSSASFVNANEIEVVTGPYDLYYYITTGISAVQILLSQESMYSNQQAARVQQNMATLCTLDIHG